MNRLGSKWARRLWRQGLKELARCSGGRSRDEREPRQDRCERWLTGKFLAKVERRRECR